jgi:hypothetical protein
MKRVEGAALELYFQGERIFVKMISPCAPQFGLVTFQQLRLAVYMKAYQTEVARGPELNYRIQSQLPYHHPPRIQTTLL